MAITWKQKVVSHTPEGNLVETWENAGTTHEGCVYGVPFTRVVRVMSDIYSDEYYVHVIDPETLTINTVHLGGAFECNMRSGQSEIDVSPDLRARFEAAAAVRAEAARIEAAARAEAVRIEEAEKAMKAPTVGRMVQVVRGRKVPKGTTGWVFWARDGRVGIALSDRRDPVTNNRADVAWVDAAYCVALPEGNTPEEVQARIDADRDAFDALRARKPVKATPVNDKAPF